MYFQREIQVAGLCGCISVLGQTESIRIAFWFCSLDGFQSPVSPRRLEPGKMTLTPSQWHHRFQQQARWTAELRRFLFDRAGLGQADRVIEVGCGTGAVLAEMPARPQTSRHGLDIHFGHLALARRNASGAHLAQGDAHHLPYATGVFDLTLCHFLLLWVAEPLQVVREMARITRPGGALLSLAEPDYGGRVDYPWELAELGARQVEALRRQGADPHLGRRLAALLLEAGLQSVEAGVLGGRWSGPRSVEALDAEWTVIRADLEGSLSAADLEELYAIDRSASGSGARILYVPTFYAWGRVPD